MSQRDNELMTFILAEYFHLIYPSLCKTIPRERIAAIHKNAKTRVHEALKRYEK